MAAIHEGVSFAICRFTTFKTRPRVWSHEFLMTFFIKAESSELFHIRGCWQISGPIDRCYAYRVKVKGETMTTNLSRLLTWAQYGAHWVLCASDAAGCRSDHQTDVLVPTPAHCSLCSHVAAGQWKGRSRDLSTTLWNGIVNIKIVIFIVLCQWWTCWLFSSGSAHLKKSPLFGY